eukprot:CAMPEP_0184859762 /NCGR_PEP_ID=MMETSP0580-20130426/4760_1 /TAXON_ID=1118495 /ORGANISM="Dactyliosolen fragilissimus" /LENGTH=583 /DNA_ID=CAMNT_0027356591 /DNA_START=172 /DNA_END=1923 /DNA_ORIENTATION=-
MNSTNHFTVKVDVENTILQVKEAIAVENESGRCPVGRQRLIHKGRILSDDSKTLRELNIVGENETIYLVKGKAPSVQTGSNENENSSLSNNALDNHQSDSPYSSFGAQNGTRNNNTANSTPSTTNQQPFDMQNFMQMQGAGATGSMGLPGMDQMMQQLMQNPDMMNSIMNSPMMQNLMSNPDTMRNMMESNPQMRQLIDQNPDLRNVFDDPEFMSRSMEMMRDPTAMQNMMRNQDLAMSQIENLPGGFSALRRMYEDVHEPLMDAMSNQTSSTSSPRDNQNSTATSTTSGSGATGAAIPNPWGTSSSSSSRSTPNAHNNQIPIQSSMNINPWAHNTNNHNPPQGSTPPSQYGNTPSIMPNSINLEQTISMLENPIVNQMMNQMMENPQAMQAMMDSNPMLRQMRESNPVAANMMSDPQTMRAMMNPQNLRAMSQMQNAMQQLDPNGTGMPFGSPLNPNTTSSGNNTTYTQGAVSNEGTVNFTSLLNQFQSTTVSSQHPSEQRQVQRFQIQMTSLNDMGFDNMEANTRALEQANGNVNRAIDILLSEPPQPPISVTHEQDNSDNRNCQSDDSDTNKNVADKKND